MTTSVAPPVPAPPSPVTAQAPVRSVPQAVDSERAVLGSIMMDPSIAVEVLDVLSPSDFYTTGHAAIFEALLRCVAAGKPPEIAIVCNELRTHGELDTAGGWLYLASLEQFVMASSAAPAHAAIVRDKAALRRIIAASESMIKLAESESTPPEEAVSKAHELFFSACEARATSRTQNTSDVYAETIQTAMEVRSARSEGRVIGIPTNFDSVDRVLGGLKPKELTILAARPSIGKTAAGVSIFEYVHGTLHRTGIYFSLEMTNVSISTRAACHRAGVSLRDACEGTLSDYEFSKFVDACDGLTGTPGLYNDTSTFSASDLRLQVRMLKQRHPGLCLIIVDGLWLMTHPFRSGYNEAAAVGETSRGLKQIAKDFDLHVLLLHQLNRNSEDRATTKERASGSGGRPTLSDLRASGAVEQDADKVILLHRERPNQEKVQQDPIIPLEFIIAKNRNGPIGTGIVHYNLVTQRMHSKARP